MEVMNDEARLEVCRLFLGIIYFETSGTHCLILRIVFCFDQPSEGWTTSSIPFHYKIHAQSDHEYSDFDGVSDYFGIYLDPSGSVSLREETSDDGIEEVTNDV